MGGPELIILVMVLGFWALFIWALVDIIRKPDWVFRAARRNKPAWIIGVIIFGCAGSLIYALMVRPSLQEAERRGYEDYLGRSG